MFACVNCLNGMPLSKNSQSQQILLRPVIMTAIALCLSPLAGLGQADESTPELVAPAAFTTNCQACHLLDQMLVGPSLVEISELYPPSNLDDFIQWCIAPGQKRDNLPQMPSMVHVEKAELKAIHDYIRQVSVGVEKVKAPQTDPFALSPGSVRRPRVERTFVPESGPASVVVALPTEPKLNVIWDTDQCRLRYISQGEVNRWPYLRSNGNALADVGEIGYVETESIFLEKSPQYEGYRISPQGYPTFVYRVGEIRVMEKIFMERGTIVRAIRATPKLPPYHLPEYSGETCTVEFEESGRALNILYRPLK